jgi:hypothetical protein
MVRSAATPRVSNHEAVDTWSCAAIAEMLQPPQRHCFNHVIRAFL